MAISELDPYIAIIVGNLAGFLSAYPVERLSLSGVRWLALAICLSVVAAVGYWYMTNTNDMFQWYAAGAFLGFIGNFAFRYGAKYPGFP